MRSRSLLLLRRHGAFSLVELLVVMGIISILIAVAIPAFNSVGRGQNISSGGDMVAGVLELARQKAMTENQRIECRIWKLPDFDGAESWDALQIFRVDDGTPLEKVQRLPDGVVMTESSPFSSVLANGAVPGGVGPFQGTDRNYKAVRFAPDGSTDLDPSGVWTLTVVPRTSEPTAERPADNFATVQVDPITGRSTIYRP